MGKRCPFVGSNSIDPSNVGSFEVIKLRGSVGGLTCLAGGGLFTIVEGKDTAEHIGIARQLHRPQLLDELELRNDFLNFTCTLRNIVLEPHLPGSQKEIKPTIYPLRKSGIMVEVTK